MVFRLRDQFIVPVIFQYFNLRVLCHVLVSISKHYRNSSTEILLWLLRGTIDTLCCQRSIYYYHGPIERTESFFSLVSWFYNFFQKYPKRPKSFSIHLYIIILILYHQTISIHVWSPIYFT
jgi:hypothetical protein